MSSEKTQMVDLLSSSKKKSLTIKNFSKDGFLIDNKLYNHSILISSENIQTWNIDAQITDKNFNFTIFQCIGISPMKSIFVFLYEKLNIFI